MSGPNPPDRDLPEGADLPGQEPGSGSGGPETSETDMYSQAYSAPESEQFTSGPYVPADSALYDYDSYEPTEQAEPAEPPRWPWVVGVVAIVAAIALVVVRVGPGNEDRHQQPRHSGHHDDDGAAGAGRDHYDDPAPTAAAATDDDRAAATAAGDSDRHRGAVSAATTAARRGSATAAGDAAPPPPPETTRAGPRQVTYSVTGTKAPGDIITVTYIDASGRSRTQRNVYIPWSLTVTPISQSEVGSVQASSLFLVSRLNCSITTSDGTVLSSNTNNSAQTAC